MNFISEPGTSDVCLELKYCERCGGLWFRRQGREEAHCGRCRAELAERWSLLHAGRARTRRRVERKAAGRIETLMAVAAMANRSEQGVRA